VAVSVNAFAGGTLLGWAIESIPIESLGFGGWTRSAVLAAVAIAAPLVMSVAILRGIPAPSFARLLGPRDERTGDRLACAIGAVSIGLFLISFVVSLGLVFDPRYRDFPFAALTAAVVPFLVHKLAVARHKGARSIAEAAGATMLALSVSYIVFNEGFANWQSLWTCAALAGLAINLALVRDAQG
jgi:hypothetical protein